ncbi:hypothetical protein LXL04_035183 [Taraxacum kok-saghyz]
MSATIQSSSSSAQKEMVCHCQLPVRICTSKTKEHHGKKFRVCPNSLYWEWDEEPVQQSLDAEIAAIKEDVSDLKKEVLELKKKKRGHRVHISYNLL